MNRPTPYQEFLIDRFTKEVLNRSDEVDFDHQRDWYDLAYGFFLGCTVRAEEATYITNECMKRNLL